MKFMDVVEEVVYLAVRDGYLKAEEANQWSEAEKIDWFNRMLAKTKDSEPV